MEGNINIDGDFLYFEQGPTLNLREWAFASLQAWQFRDQTSKISDLLPDKLKDEAERVVDWLKNNQPAFEKWAQENPETWALIKGLLIFIGTIIVGAEISFPD